MRQIAVWQTECFRNRKQLANPRARNQANCTHGPLSLIALFSRSLSSRFTCGGSADGNYEIRAASSKALVHSNGLVEWSPRVQLKSNCNIDLHLYPLDSQQCSLRFGTWTKGSPGINLQLTSSNQTIDHNKWHLKNGIDLSAFEGSAEYEIVAATAQVRRKRSTHYPQPYEELVFSVHLKRKSLLYTLHLVGPCMIISALSICVFHLPTRSKEKVRVLARFSLVFLWFC